MIVTAVSTRYISTRSTMPLPRSIPAPSEATPVANGFTVEHRVPTPAPSMMTATPVIRSKPSATMIGTINA